eukprot:3741517-Rhodomonas_salina.1
MKFGGVGGLSPLRSSSRGGTNDKYGSPLLRRALQTGSPPGLAAALLPQSPLSRTPLGSSSTMSRSLDRSGSSVSRSDSKGGYEMNVSQIQRMTSLAAIERPGVEKDHGEEVERILEEKQRALAHVQGLMDESDDILNADDEVSQRRACSDCRSPTKMFDLAFTGMRSCCAVLCQDRETELAHLKHGMSKLFKEHAARQELLDEDLADLDN